MGGCQIAQVSEDKDMMVAHKQHTFAVKDRASVFCL
jgi:hypothetical protein